MEKWKIIKSSDVERRLTKFLKDHPERAGEVDALLEEIQNYPNIRWAMVHRDSERFYADRNQQLRFAGKAYPSNRTIILTHFSDHV
jgi:hypothetical protein